MKKLALVICICLLSGCAYNSRNVFEFKGRDMDLSYGLIAVKHVDRVIIYRETNAGKAPAPKPLGEPKWLQQCSDVDTKTVEAVCEELKNDGI